MKTSVYEIYNGQIPVMRQNGATLQEIGNYTGVTREWIRQLLKAKYGNVGMSVLSEGKLARLIGCPVKALTKLRKQGILHPRHTSSLYLYDSNEIGKAMLAVPRNCVHCGEPLLKHRGKYCSKCSRERQRYTYPFLSKEAKRKHLDAVLSWQRRHPEQNKIIQNRASKTYLKKWRREHYAMTQYIVVCGKVLPIGSIFKALRCEHSYLILDNGLKIPVCHIRKEANK